MHIADIKHPSKTLQDKLHALYNLRLGTKLSSGFRPVYYELLEKFKNPHENLPPVIHIAGTNGKGSIVAFMRSIFKHTGLKAHSYTSPHLLRFNERIQLAGNDIQDDYLEELIDEAVEYNQGKDITFFEITTAMAFAAFSKLEADICLLEVGMGGKLDCTNVIKSPLVSVINTIGLDHQEYLGETLEEIALEKAGIIKSGRPCILGAQNSSFIEDIIGNIALEKKAPIYNYNKEWGISLQQILKDSCEAGKTSEEKAVLEFSFLNKKHQVAKPSLIGQHQILNLGAALAAYEIFSKETQQEAQFQDNINSINKGISLASWPARLQKITTGPCAVLAAKDTEVWYDGGHNEDAAKVLEKQIKIWQDEISGSAENKNKEQLLDIHIILGMKQDKNAAAFLDLFLPYIKTITVVPLPGIQDVITMEDIDRYLRSISSQKTNNKKLNTPKNAVMLYEAGSIREAIKAIKSKSENANSQKSEQEILRDCKGRKQKILICGSLYLASQIEN